MTKKLNPNKATGPDKIPPKIVILSAKIIGSHLANIRSSYSEVFLQKGVLKIC